MSGALKGVFGGGGIFGALMNVASMAFPPLALANSLANVLVQAIGKAVMQAVSTLIQESGMPKFLGSAIGSMLEKVLGGQMKQTDASADSAVQSDQGVQNWEKDFIEQLSSRIVENARKGVSKENEGKGKAGGKASAGSWLQAIAEAMGSIAGDKASDMVGLSKQMSDLSAAAKGIGKDDTKGQQANAKEFSIVQAKFQAASQEYSILQNTFANAIKSIGEGLAAMGRKG
jgi:hypothetical protein